MAKGIMPDDPVRADYRYLHYLMKSSKGKLQPSQAELDRIIRAFQRLGGSWENIFKGSSKDITLLKRLIRIASKNDLITKAPRL